MEHPVQQDSQIGIVAAPQREVFFGGGRQPQTLSEQGSSQLVVPGLHSTTPPSADPQTMMQRLDEINDIQRILSDPQSSAVVLVGMPGVGKSTLAAIWYRRLLLARQQGNPATPRHMVWLTLNSYTTLPDVIIAILKGIGMLDDPALATRKPEQQVSALLRALRRPHEHALIVLDQFESLLYPEVSQGTAGRGAIKPFLHLLQANLGDSRVVLTCHQSLFADQEQAGERVRTYEVTRINMPEGMALLRQRGVLGTSDDYSLAWQRCSGHVFALVLVSALIQQSDITLQTLLTSPTYQALWSSNVSVHLIERIQRYLNPLQETILQTLCLFHEPAPAEGLKRLVVSKQAGDGPGTATLCERELQRLVQLGLVHPLLDATSQPCYTLHILLQRYLLEHIAENGLQRNHLSSGAVAPTQQASETQQNVLIAGHIQVAGYYLQVIAERCPPRERRQSTLEIEPIIHAIRHLTLGNRWQGACALLFEEGLHESLLMWGSWNTLLGLYTALLPPSGSLPRRDEGLVASHLAMLYGRLGELQQSHAYFEQALAAQREVGDRQGEAMTLTNRGELFRAQGDYEHARSCFERATALISTSSDAYLRCTLLHNLGLIFQQSKEYTQALQCYSEALQLASQLGNQHFTGTILTNLGLLLYEQQQPQDGLALLLAALRVREMIHDPDVLLLERFLVALEQKMGGEAYTEACRAALAIQPRVFARFAPQNM